MIPTTENHTTQTNIEGTKIALRFDPASTVHLMSLLTEAYTDPEMAVVREYSVNGLDSHIEAGQTRPIEVETPSALRPLLVIRDFGVGLNQHDIETVYSLYGASTKRDTNEQTGGLGIGGKSALAYTSQFTVVGIKNGVKTVVNVALDDEGAGSMTIVETVDTDEHNGVEIRVPVHRYNDFETKALQLFRYWKPGTVLVNGKEPAHLDGLKLTENMMLVERHGYCDNASVVVIGSVPYEIPREFELMKGILESHRVVAQVPVGSMAFPPSREKLKLTAKTKAALEALNVAGEAVLAEAIQRDVNEAADKPEALRKAIEWKRAIDKREATEAVKAALDNLTYNGQNIPKILQLPETKNAKGEDYRPKFRTTNRKSDKLSDTHSQSYLEASTALNTIIVTGYTADSFTPSHKKKLNAGASQEDITGEHYALFNDVLPEDLDWFDRPIIRWDDAKTIKLERTYVKGARKQLQGSYDVHEGARTIEKKVDELEGDLYYYTTDEFKVSGYNAKEKEIQALRQLTYLFKKYRPDAMVIRLGLNRVDKFLRDFPEAERAKPELVTMYNEILSELGEDGMEAFMMHEHGNVDILDKLDADLIDDPMLRHAVTIAHIDIDATKRKLAEFHGYNLNLPFAKAKGDPSDVYDLAEHYPLASHCNEYRSYGTRKDQNKLWSHIYIYLNSCYQRQQDEAKMHQKSST